jgi:transposase
MNSSKNVVGIDIAKRVFQLHWIDQENGEIVSLKFKREKFLEHFANRQQCLIGMEACGGAQHWARKVTAMGHQVKLLPGKAVKPFVTGNKNDRQDARAIRTAVQQPTSRPSPSRPKSNRRCWRCTGCAVSSSNSAPPRSTG